MMRRNLRILGLLLIANALNGAAVFDVAAIHQHEGEIRSVTLDVGSNFVLVTAMTVSELIAFAYDIQEYQVRGGDSWITQARWDIRASAGDRELTRSEAREMMQGLLAERFGLSVHRSSMDLPVYVMTAAKAGAKLKPPTPFDSERSTFYGDGAIWKNAPLEILNNPYPLHLERPIVNRTGLAGRYDFELKFKPSPTQVEGAGGESVFTILEEQLGLHLQKDRAPVDVLVVDQTRKPTEN